MFKLDSFIFNLIYNQCKTIGSTFGYGALEGFIIYLGIFALGIVKYSNSKKVVKK